MRVEAASAGFYQAPFAGTEYPRLQILTVAQLLEHEQIRYPRYAGNVTMKRAVKASAVLSHQPPLSLSPETP